MNTKQLLKDLGIQFERDMLNLGLVDFSWTARLAGAAGISLPVRVKGKPGFFTDFVQTPWIARRPCGCQYLGKMEFPVWALQDNGFLEDSVKTPLWSMSIAERCPAHEF